MGLHGARMRICKARWSSVRAIENTNHLDSGAGMDVVEAEVAEMMRSTPLVCLVRRTTSMTEVILLGGQVMEVKDIM
jgi:hypothetical protein